MLGWGDSCALRGRDKVIWRAKKTTRMPMLTTKNTDVHAADRSGGSAWERAWGSGPSLTPLLGATENDQAGDDLANHHAAGEKPRRGQRVVRMPCLPVSAS